MENMSWIMKTCASPTWRDVAMAGDGCWSAAVFAQTQGLSALILSK